MLWRPQASIVEQAIERESADLYSLAHNFAQRDRCSPEGLDSPAVARCDSNASIPSAITAPNGPRRSHRPTDACVE